MKEGGLHRASRRSQLVAAWPSGVSSPPAFSSLLEGSKDRAGRRFETWKPTD